MRLIVGADLTEGDVNAILAGDQARLDNVLLKELEPDESWTSSVEDGVALLSYMVASGKLEVRVAIRKNANTGMVTTWDSTEDGFVHEKWFIMTDSDKNSLYGSGSINESRV